MTSTFEGETESDMEDIKTLVSTKLKAHVDAGYSGIGAEFSAKRMKAEGKLTKNFDEKVEDKIRVVRKQYGGRPITKQFTEDDWVNNLRVESTDWVVTDRGDSRPSDHVGVWDLLPKDLSGIHDILYDFFSTFFYRNRISRIMNIGNNLESIGNALKDIEITTQRRCTTDGVTKEWLQLLQDDGNISQFLLTPDRHLPSLTTAGLEEIADTLDKLLGYVGANDFQNKRKISQLNADIKDRTQTRKQVKNITQTTADCTTKLRQLLADAKKLKPGDWVQVLREDNTVRSFLLQSLDRSIQQILNGKAKENADLVNQLVNLAGKETFPSRDDILKKLGTRKLFVCGT